MPRCVLDTSICVDLFNAGLLDIVLRLPYEFLLPDVVIEELEEPRGSWLLELGYTSVSLEGRNVAKVIALAERYRKASPVDLFALVYAQAHGCMLLTGDSFLRAAAEVETVEVHGVLWLLDEVVTHNVLLPPDAANALERMVATGSWLPKDECEMRIQKWRA